MVVGLLGVHCLFLVFLIASERAGSSYSGHYFRSFVFQIAVISEGYVVVVVPETELWQAWCGQD